MGITKDLILKALSTVEDPDLKKDLVTLNMIKDLVVEGNKVRFSVELTTPACPLKEILKNGCVEAINEAISEPVDLDINMTASVTTSRNEGPILPRVKNIIAVASGKGGVGKSTITANLGVALAQSGAKVGIIDADIFGPSIPTMFNCEQEQPAIIKNGDQNLIVPILQYGVKIISIGFLTPSDNAVVWRGPMASAALRQFISETDWGELDYLLIDLPPGTSDIHLTMVQTVPVTGAVIVTTPQKVALADARKGIAMFRQPQINVPVLGLIENMAYFTPEELPENKYFIFGQDGGIRLAQELEIELLGQIPLVQKVRESGDNGYPAVLKDDISARAFQLVANSLAQQVAIRNATADQTKKVEIKV